MQKQTYTLDRHLYQMGEANAQRRARDPRWRPAPYTDTQREREAANQVSLESEREKRNNRPRKAPRRNRSWVGLISQRFGRVN